MTSPYPVSPLAPLVFIVDDERTTLYTLEAVIRKGGFRTASATTADAALPAIESLHPDLVLLDVNLGSVSGLDICRTLHGSLSTASVPILLISVDQETATKVRGLDAGAVDYIAKPIVGDEVLARVRSHLRRHRYFQEQSAQQIERVHRLAQAKQMLMPLPEDMPGAHFAVSMQQVLGAGGDFYDVLPRGGRVYDYLIADATGHDLAASYWTAALKALASGSSDYTGSPVEFVQFLNTSLCRFLPPGAFFTLIYARFDHATGKMLIVNAAHPPAILVAAKSHVAFPIRQQGDVVGAFADAVFSHSEIQLAPGDRVYFYSDGALEVNGLGEHGLTELCSACTKFHSFSLEDTTAELMRHLTGGAPTRDDIVIMGVER